MYLMRQFALFEEANPEGSTGGGGGEVGDTGGVDIDAASDSIAADLNLSDDSGSATPSPDEDEGGGSAAPTQKRSNLEHKDAGGDTAGRDLAAAKEALAARKVSFDGKTDAEILELAAGGEAAPSGRREAPKSWKPEMRELFSKLPPEAQAYIEARENEVSEGFVKYAEESKYGKSLKEVIAPYQPLLDAQGVKDHGQAVRYLLNAHYQLSSADGAKRAQYFAQLAKSYGIDMQAVQIAATHEPPYQDPEVKALRERLDAQDQERRLQQQREYETLKAQTDNEVKAFAEEKDEKGQPKRPYFDEVADHIVLLLQNPRKTLEQAYEEAVWANPVTRKKELDRQRVSDEARLRAEADKVAKEKLRSRGTQLRDTSKSSPKDPLGSMEDTMRETLGKIKERA